MNGYLRADRNKRDAAVEAFAAMFGRVRKHDGCLDASISPRIHFEAKHGIAAWYLT
jgi:hypothetical protein